MATSSIYDKVNISDPKVAEAFVKAIEESESAQREKRSGVEAKMASREDTIRLHEMRKKRRAAVG